MNLYETSLGVPDWSRTSGYRNLRPKTRSDLDEVHFLALSRYTWCPLASFQALSQTQRWEKYDFVTQRPETDTTVAHLKRRSFGVSARMQMRSGEIREQ